MAGLIQPDRIKAERWYNEAIYLRSVGWGTLSWEGYCYWLASWRSLVGGAVQLLLWGVYSPRGHTDSDADPYSWYGAEVVHIGLCTVEQSL